MTEKDLRDNITDILSKQGWVCWWSPRVKFRKQQDIFTMWDGVVAKKDKVRFIQFTTKENKASHIKKIREFKRMYDLSHEGELWLLDKKTKDWEVIDL